MHGFRPRQKREPHRRLVANQPGLPAEFPEQNFNLIRSWPGGQENGLPYNSTRTHLNRAGAACRLPTSPNGRKANKL